MRFLKSQGVLCEVNANHFEDTDLFHVDADKGMAVT